MRAKESDAPAPRSYELAVRLRRGRPRAAARQPVRTDVERQDGGVVVRLGGARPRQVWVLDRYADAVAAAAERCDEQFMLGGIKADRRSVTTGLLHSIAGDPALPALEPSRLRSTWLVSHLAAGTRLDVLMAAAGLASTTSLGDLVCFLDPLPAGAVGDLLRGGGQRPPSPLEPRASIALPATPGRSGA
ncbi:MAG: hypothetical protein ABIS21_00830 [Acidimicrobiales bacterium]